jgi:hypothetical protein
VVPGGLVNLQSSKNLLDARAWLFASVIIASYALGAPAPWLAPTLALAVIRTSEWDGLGLLAHA